MLMGKSNYNFILDDDGAGQCTRTSKLSLSFKRLIMGDTNTPARELVSALFI